MSLFVDYISMPPKSQEVSSIQGAEHTKLQHGEQEIASQFQQNVEKNTQTTVSRNKAENEQLKNDERDRERKKKKKKQSMSAGKGRGAGADNKSDNVNLNPDEGGRFDMRI